MLNDNAVGRSRNRYQLIIEQVFRNHHVQDLVEFEFTRDEFVAIAKSLNVVLPKNPGDVIYSFRYRNELPETIRKTADIGFDWIIVGAGRARFRFRQVPRATNVNISAARSTAGESPVITA